MPKLVWNAIGERRFEVGVDRGVLYPRARPGVPWNGLVAVSQNVSGGETQPYWADGKKFAQYSDMEEYESTIEAYTYPPEFEELDGTYATGKGLAFGLQPRREFGLSYRTLIGNDVNGTDHGYIIHLVYNCLAAPSDKEYETIEDEVEAVTFSWDITTRNEPYIGGQDTAHVMIDSTKTHPGLLSIVEAIIYGAGGVTPRLPLPNELHSLFNSWVSTGVPEKFNLIGLMDNTRQTLTNLYMNPSFERAVTTADIYKNLWTNPSFETLGGADREIRRNRYLRPNMDSLVGLSAVNGAIISMDAGKVLVSAPVNAFADSGIALVSNCPAVNAGETLTYSFDVTGVVEDEWRVSIQGTPLASNYNGPLVRVGVGETKRISATVTFANAGNPAVYVLRRTASIASTAYVGKPLVERGSLLSTVPSPFFSGAVSPDSDLVPSWTGTANASESILTGKQVIDVGSVSAYSSASWSLPGGSRSIHVSGRWDSNDSYASIGGDAGGLRLGMEAGKTYTVLATARMTEPMTGQINGRARTVTLHTRAGGAHVPSSSPQTPNIAGVHQIRWTFTIPANSVEAFLRLYNGAYAGEGEIWWDNVLLIEGDYKGPYFDGSTLPMVRRNLSVSPAANRFTSTTEAGWSTNRWFGSTGGTGVHNIISMATDGPVGITTYARKSWTGAPINNGATGYGAGQFETSEGKTYAFSAYLRAFSETLKQGTVRLTWRKADGTIVDDTVSPLVNMPNGEWVRLTRVATAPVGSVRVSVAMDINGGVAWSVGDRLDATGLLVEESNVIGDYFDGDSLAKNGIATAWMGAVGNSVSGTYDVDFSTAWLGIANASQSVVRHLVPADLDGSGGRAAIVSSQHWSKSGSRSLRVIPVHATNRDTYARVASIGAGPGARIVAGKTYTVLATARQAGSIVDIPSGNGTREITFIGSGFNVKSTPGPNVEGVTQHRLTFTVPVGTTYAEVRLYHGGLPEAGDLWWDNVLLIEGTYTGTYFDGANAGVYQNQELITSWTGTENQSTSIGTYLTGLPVTANPGDAFIVQETNRLWVLTNGVWRFYPIMPITF